MLWELRQEGAGTRLTFLTLAVSRRQPAAWLMPSQPENSAFRAALLILASSAWRGFWQSHGGRLPGGTLTGPHRPPAATGLASIMNFIRVISG